MSPGRPQPARIAVVGGGMSGLSCAYELARNGHEVKVLEAQSRVGGRVFTLRNPFGDGLIAEVGAQFLPDNHALPLKYAREFGLELVPLNSSGKPKTLDGTELNLFKSKELIVGIVSKIGGWPSDPRFREAYDELDAISFANFLQQRGVKESEIQQFELSFIGNFGDGVSSISARAAIHQYELQRDRKASYSIAGGNDTLATAFATRLEEQVLLKTVVTAVTQQPGETCVIIQFERADKVEHEKFDYAVLCVPPGPMKRIHFSPSLSPQKTNASARCTSVARIFLEVEKRFWALDAPAMLATQSDPRIRWMIGSALHSQRDILVAYVIGRTARDMLVMNEQSRISWIARQAELAFPEWRPESIRSIFFSWDADPFALGGYAWPGPGEMRIVPELARSEGRIHFAGDHTTYGPGWIQSAMESGLRAAHEISQRLK